MSYTIPEWVRPMLQERWGRYAENSVDDVGAPEWKSNERPRELAREYLRLAEWAQKLESELGVTSKLLGRIGSSFADLSPKTLQDQARKSEAILKAVPGYESDDQAA